MAKRDPKVFEASPTPTAPLPQPEPQPLPAQPEPAKPVGPKKFRCSLSASTPVAFNNVEIEAESDSEARRKFFAMNGIDFSVHPFTATEV